jgi:hypothetical protein
LYPAPLLIGFEPYRASDIEWGICASPVSDVGWRLAVLDLISDGGLTFAVLILMWDGGLTSAVPILMWDGGLTSAVPILIWDGGLTSAVPILMCLKCMTDCFDLFEDCFVALVGCLRLI